MSERLEREASPHLVTVLTVVTCEIGRLVSHIKVGYCNCICGLGYQYMY